MLSIAVTAAAVVREQAQVIGQGSKGGGSKGGQLLPPSEQLLADVLELKRCHYSRVLVLVCEGGADSNNGSAFGTGLKRWNEFVLQLTTTSGVDLLLCEDQVANKFKNDLVLPALRQPVTHTNSSYILYIN